MFRLIALKPLEGCEKHILKCLKTNMMYYFCNDYRIAEDESYIERRSKNIQPLQENFFLEHPKVNISAVVGMNGDGKSTIVELLMRLINNCAISYNLRASEDSLRRVDGVKATIYYMIDNTFYKLTESSEESDASVWELGSIRVRDEIKSEWSAKRKIDLAEESHSFFFTLVSNYSHYAYNTMDFWREWTETGDEENEEERCWLHHIFHKNDGYLAPITLHPYRKKGNIDINQERELSKQRLLSIFINAENPEVNPSSIRRINGKDAKLIVLKPLSYSKLQQTCLIDFFNRSKAQNNFKGVLNQIKKVDNDGKFSDIEYERLVDTVIPYVFEDRIDELLGVDSDFHKFIVSIISWLEKEYPEALPAMSDIEEVLYRLQQLRDKFRGLNLKLNIGKLKRKYRYLKHLNTSQLARLDMIYRVCKMSNENVALVTKNFDELSWDEKCRQYIIYKRWSILTTYPQYKEFVFSDQDQGKLYECGMMLYKAFEKLMEDKTSHETRKLRQIENYRQEGFDGGDLYERIGVRDEETNALLVDMDVLKQHYGAKQVFLDNMPPALYEWDMKFKKVGSQESDIEFDSFSSGEKQMLNSLGAIIYHLQNINTTAMTQYSNVNVILEEIELYYHPECQRTYIQLLLNQLNGVRLDKIRNINIVFVTHSPFILSDVPKCNVLFLRNGMDEHLMQENTFGANIHSLLKNGFFLPNLTMGEFAYQKIHSLFGKLNSGDFEQDELEEIYQEILLVGEPFLRSQMLGLYHSYRGVKSIIAE